MTTASAIEFTTFRGNKSGQIYRTTTKRGPLQKDEVLVKITHSGLCYTDVHFKTMDIALGHEGVGVVEDAGPEAKILQKGQRVGFGYLREACGHCEMCLTGDDMYCPDAVLYAQKDLDQASFGSHIVIREPFLLRVPDDIASEDAGPLMCGGITVFEPTLRYGTKSTHRVGIIGIGGLGHLAIQFLSKMGCQVVVFSSSESKKEEAMSLGAAQFVVTKGKKKGELDIGKKLNQLFVTSSAPPDWDLVVPLLAPHCTVFPLVVNMGALDIPNMAVNLTPLTVQGSACGRRHSYAPMFSFCGQHGIKPMIKKYPMSEEGITEAFKDIESGNIRYRAVLEWRGDTKL